MASVDLSALIGKEITTLNSQVSFEYLTFNLSLLNMKKKKVWKSVSHFIHSIGVLWFISRLLQVLFVTE